jgi:2-polyprenyl-3-methyl-5-hydroxy-6-metoxy-1,4-benzoquinol methylase
MMFLSSLKQRQRRPEIMDDPALEAARHVHALAGLARINWISGSDRILWRPLLAMTRNNPGRIVRVLDIATGAGDVPIGLWRRGRGAGLNLEVSGGDISPTALAVANQNARAAGADVKFFKLDVQNDGIPAGFDVLTCSLFLHHLSEEQAVALLGQMQQAAGRMVLINDLRRCRLGFVMAWTASRILTTSAVVRVDAPRSALAAFTLAEIRALADQAGMASAAISRHWPCRYLLAWRRS